MRLNRSPSMRLWLTALFAAGTASAQQPPAPSTPPAQGGAPTGTPAPANAPQQGPRPYDQVITRAARSDSGLFLIHRVGARLYFEVPDSLLGRDMLLISKIHQAPEDLSPFLNAGSSVAEQLVRWEREGDRILLRALSYRYVADDSLPIARSVQANTFAPIIRSFAVAAVGKDSAARVIEVTSLFEDDVPAISGLNNAQRTQFRVRRLDPARTFLDRAKSFPLNIQVVHTQTFDAAEPPSQQGTGTISMQLSQSMVLLPRHPMRPRYADERVGWFTTDQIDFSSRELKASARSLIQRWRLEPKDPAAYARGELVEPVKPIVYYLDPATPMEWRSFIKAGIESWQTAFEGAGFKNAILARDPPSPSEDPDFDPDDVRYSTVRYVANLTRNATGPSVADPRTGEIIESDIIWYHNHLRSYRNRLMVETGAANPAARSLRIPEQLIGETVKQVIAHEIGHALGLPHNMGGSSALPVDSLRSPSYTERYGVSPSIMDYARQNYVAQPGDGVTRFVRKLGPYDSYAINWGYRVIPQAATPDAERPILDRWIKEKANDPMYRFADGSAIDPSAQTEDIGDDPVRASRLGLANLRRVTPELTAWTSTPGIDYTELRELYGELVQSYNRYVGHVVTVIGGVYGRSKSSDQPGPVFNPVPAVRQRAAMKFFVDEVFTAPTWLVEENLLRRIESAGAIDRVRQVQAGIVNRLLDPARMLRLSEAEVYQPAQAYRLSAMLDDLKNGIWGADLTGTESVNVWRRNLQRAHLARLAALMQDAPAPPAANPNAPAPVAVAMTDIRPLVRAQLVSLRAAARARVARTADPVTRAHFDDVVARIAEVLEGNRR
ncbi:MAG: zinc-dependent metalloprotease [Gemmatimonadales bacterium]|nr:zinc-dependent metalloprotease [Gemmatimonadales bacterium]